VPSSSSAPTQHQSVPPQVSGAAKSEGVPEEINEQIIVNELPEYCVDSGNRTLKSEDLSYESVNQAQNADDESSDAVKAGDYEDQVDLVTGLSGLTITEHTKYESDGYSGDNMQSGTASTKPPPPPVPPPKPAGSSSNLRRFVSGTSESPRFGPSRRPIAWPVQARTSPSESRPSSPRSHCESEGYNSADEQNPCFGSSIYDLVSIF